MPNKGSILEVAASSSLSGRGSPLRIPTLLATYIVHLCFVLVDSNLEIS